MESTMDLDHIAFLGPPLREPIEEKPVIVSPADGGWQSPPWAGRMHEPGTVKELPIRQDFNRAYSTLTVSGNETSDAVETPSGGVGTNWVLWVLGLAVLYGIAKEQKWI